MRWPVRRKDRALEPPTWSSSFWRRDPYIEAKPRDLLRQRSFRIEVEVASVHGFPLAQSRRRMCSSRRESKADEFLLVMTAQPDVDRRQTS
jgi:hypothetical protein